MTNEELDKLEAEIKATQAAYEAGDIIFKETHKAARAYLAAQRQMSDTKDNINLTVEGHTFEKMSEFVAYSEGRKDGWNSHIKAAQRQGGDAGAHCHDCCCARSWKALGVTEYTGKSIPEHIEELRVNLATCNQSIQAYLDMQRQTPADRAEALTNSVPVEAMNKIELALLDSRAVFAILKHDKPDDHPYNLLFENCDKALHELEPHIKKDENK